MSRWEWLGGAFIVGAIGLVIAGAPSERKAAQVVARLGGRYQIERRFGFDCLGVIVQVDLSNCRPAPRDLAEIKALRHLRVLDLSLTPIGDRELVELVDSQCQFIIVPDGQTSRRVRSMFSEDQLGFGIGISELALPGANAFSVPAELMPPREAANRPSAPLAAKRTPKIKKQRPIGGKARTAAAIFAFTASLS